MDISATPHQVAIQAHAAAIDVSRSGADFAGFYRTNAESVARALAITLRDPELAAEATNEGMIRAYQQWSKISAYENPAAWVYRVGLNWSLSWKRRRRRERERPIALGPSHRTATERDDSMDKVLQQLSLEHRAVVVCRVHLDWSVEQTAEALGIEAGTVKSRLSRALHKLRAALDEQGVGR